MPSAGVAVEVNTQALSYLEETSLNQVFAPVYTNCNVHVVPSTFHNSVQRRSAA